LNLILTNKSKGLIFEVLFLIWQYLPYYLHLAVENIKMASNLTEYQQYFSD